MVPAQVLAELYHVLRTKAGHSPDAARAAVEPWMTAADVAPVNHRTIEAALELSSVHALQIYDAIILAAAAARRCDLLISEDLQDGFAWRGVVVTNPFGPMPDRRIQPWLG